MCGRLEPIADFAACKQREHMPRVNEQWLPFHNVHGQLAERCVLLSTRCARLDGCALCRQTSAPRSPLFRSQNCTCRPQTAAPTLPPKVHLLPLLCRVLVQRVPKKPPTPKSAFWWAVLPRCYPEKVRLVGRATSMLPRKSAFWRAVLLLQPQCYGDISLQLECSNTELRK